MEYRKQLTEQERAYDKICGTTFANIFMLTKNCETIRVRDVDIKNEEHLYVLHVAVGVGGVVGKKVSVNGSRWFVWRLNRKMGLKKDCRIQRRTTKDTMYSVSPQMLNDDMRAIAEEQCGTSFTFGDIYKEFYERKKK
jgi:hypothetical protein